MNGERRRPTLDTSSDSTALATTALAIDVGRRHFLFGSTAIASMAISGMAVMHIKEAWGVQTTALKPETMRTLVKMAHDIFPHERVPDRYYAIAVKGYDEGAARDLVLKSLIESTVEELDGFADGQYKSAYVAVPMEVDRVQLLRRIQSGTFFKQLRGDLVVSLYNQKEVWPIFGYEGPSASKGGYLTRGFDDIEWL